MGTRVVGARVTWLDDPHTLPGRSIHMDEAVLPSMCHVALVPSPHARIRGRDVSQARASRGVVAVYTLKDLWEEPLAIPVLVPKTPLLPCRRFPLALGRTRYVGEAVALVAASDRYLSDDAPELVRVDYEPLLA